MKTQLKPPVLTRSAVMGHREIVFATLTATVVVFLQSEWNASLAWSRNGMSPDDMSAAVTNGDLLRKALGILLGIAGLVWLRWCSTKRLRPLNSGIRYPLSWLIWVAASVIWSSDPHLTIRRVALLLMLVISATAFASLRASTIFVSVAVAGAVTLFVGIACEIYCGTFHPLTSGYRFAGTTHPNLQGTTMAIGVLGAIGVRITTPYRRTSAILGMICLIGLLSTNSRTAISALIISSLVAAIVLIAKNPRARYWLPHLCICALTSLLAIGVFSATFRSEGDSLGKEIVAEQRDQGNTGELNGRLDVWKICLHYASDHLLTGYGYSSFWTAAHIADISERSEWSINEAHSAYIDEILSDGIIGSALFFVTVILCLVYCAKAFWQGAKENLVWMSFLLFFLIHGISESILMPVTTYPAYIIFVGIMQLTLFQGSRKANR